MDNYDGQMIFQCNTLEIANAYKNMFPNTQADIVHREHFFEVRYHHACDSLDVGLGTHEDDEDLKTIENLNIEPNTNVIEIPYNLENINKGPRSLRQRHFTNYNFSPYVYVHLHSDKKPKHLKDAISILIDMVRHEDGLKEVPEVFKKSKLYKDMLNVLLIATNHEHYYDISHYESDTGLEQINEILDKVIDKHQIYGKYSYQTIKSIFNNSNQKHNII